MSGWSPESYTIGYRPAAKAKGLSTSSTELLHASVALVVLTFDLALIWAMVSRSEGLAAFNVPSLVAALPVGALAALSGFLLHEGAHKVAAERYGFWAEFRMSPFGLLLSVLIVLTTGFIFAAPGATIVRGMGDRRDWGKTSLAGPVVNFGAGGIFGLGAFAASALRVSAWFSPLVFLAFLNVWWGTFNLIPFGPLDGAKVWRWDREIWVGVFVPAAAIAAILYLRLNGIPL